MARTTFARTVVKTQCRVHYIDQNNDEQTTTVTLLGDYDLTTAQKAAIKQLNAKGGVVLSITHSSYYGSMSIQDFDKYCSKKDFKEW